MTYRRLHYDILKQRIEEPRRFIQVISGPRQVGKTTMVNQVLKDLKTPYHFVSADETFSDNTAWIDQQWETARIMWAKQPSSDFTLVIDEIQKISEWSTAVKRHWDADSLQEIPLKVVILGSSRLLLEEGLTESLTGRFERIQMMHWSYKEISDAFNLTADQFAWFGGYPGAIPLIEDEKRWKEYIRNSIAETTISKDILQMTRIYKPALLKRLFEFSCMYSSQIISYTKMLGQMVDAGNTTTLSHYLDLLSTAGLVTGFENYSGSYERTRASSPKLQVYNTAFISAYQSETFQDIRSKPEKWGQQVESAIGSHLANSTANSMISLYYWRKGNYEVDFILKKNQQIIGIEVKTSNAAHTSSMTYFKEKYEPFKLLLVGPSGIPWQEFLKIDPEELF